MKEIWKDFIGLEGCYKISSLGRLHNLKTGSMTYGHVDKSTGYLVYTLRKDGKQVESPYVHRVVAIHFLPNPSNLPAVTHKDDDKTNTCIDNLEWCTHEYNCKYGTRSKRSGESRINHPDKSSRVVGVNITSGLILEFPSMSEAERKTGVAHQSISACSRGKLKTAGGFKWYKI